MKSLIILAITLIITAITVNIFERYNMPKSAYWAAGAIITMLQVNAMYQIGELP